MFNLGFIDFCDDSSLLEVKIQTSPACIPISWITGIWVQSSLIAVLTFFCALILTASLLAEALDKRTKEGGFPMEENEMSSALEDWLSQFDKLNLLVDSINDFFNAILAITVFYYFNHFPLSVFNFLDYFIMKMFGKTSKTWKVILKFSLPVLMFVLRFATIAIVCQQLQVKVIYLIQSYHRRFYYYYFFLFRLKGFEIVWIDSHHLYFLLRNIGSK